VEENFNTHLTEWLTIIVAAVPRRLRAGGRVGTNRFTVVQAGFPRLRGAASLNIFLSFVGRSSAWRNDAC
jgi:hypothetical protein